MVVLARQITIECLVFQYPLELNSPAVEGVLFTRRVNASGSVQVDKVKYYIGRAYRGRSVVLQVDAANKQFKVELAEQPLKSIPIKGLEHGLMSFDHYLQFICNQAVSAWRLYLRKNPRYLPLAA